MLYFSFDELNGTQAIDHSQHQNHGTLVGNSVLVEGNSARRWNLTAKVTTLKFLMTIASLRYWINGKNAGCHRFTRDDETIDSEGQTSLPRTADRASVQVGNTHDVSPLPDRYFLGRIDEVRVWNRALSEAEILEQMNMGSSGTAANP